MPEALLKTMPHRFPTVTAARKACRRLEVEVDGRLTRCGEIVAPGSNVKWLQRMRNAPTPQCCVAPESASLVNVVYEDQHIAVLVKPRGMPVQGRGEVTLQRLLPHLLVPAQVEGSLHRPHHVHRLDKPTGGLLVIAKSRLAIRDVGRLFSERKVQKRYRALVIGRILGEGEISQPLHGQVARTTYRAVRHFRSTRFHGWLSLVDLWPATGRHHQLRKHMAIMGHPIVGDELYCPKEHLHISEGLFLWSAQISFPHPITGELLSCTSEEPECFCSFPRKEHERWSESEC